MHADDTPILFVGDVVPTSQFTIRIGGQETPLIANLEAPITANASPAIGKIVLAATQNWLVPGFLGRLRVACLGNNHILDHGLAGLLSTTNVLALADVAWFGAGRNLPGVQNGVVAELSGTRLGFCGYVCPSTHPVFATAESPGVVPPDPALIQNDVRLARMRGAERVIVALHWGAEEVPYPRPKDIELARTIVALGADLIIGHHAHCIQPFEVIAGVPVFYGLGNAIMPDLDVDRNFDEAGVSHGKYRKRQRRWNKESLLVRYTARTGAAHVTKMFWDGRTLRETGGRPKIKGVSCDSANRQAQRFKRAKFLGALRNLVCGFMERPRVPKPYHLGDFFDES